MCFKIFVEKQPVNVGIMENFPKIKKYWQVCLHMLAAVALQNESRLRTNDEVHALD